MKNLNFPRHPNEPMEFDPLLVSNHLEAAGWHWQGVESRMQSKGEGIRCDWYNKGARSLLLVEQGGRAYLFAAVVNKTALDAVLGAGK